MPSLRNVIEGNDSVLGRAFDFAVIGLIIFSLLTYSIETLPDLSPTVTRVLWYLELLTVVAFTTEYALRLIVAENKRRFVFSFFGLIDLAAILPFYLTIGIDLRSVRIFRLFRLFRILKLARYNRAIRRFHRAIVIVREEMILFGMSALFFLYLSAVGIYYCENEAQPDTFASVFHSLWWSVCTLTTVGYGDVYPITIMGKVFTFFVLATGIGIISVPAGLLASALSKAREMELLDTRKFEPNDASMPAEEPDDSLRVSAQNGSNKNLAVYPYVRRSTIATVLRLTNRWGRPVKLFIEPWAEEILLAENDSIQVTHDHVVELETHEDGYTLFGDHSTKLSIYRGTELIWESYGHGPK